MQQILIKSQALGSISISQNKQRYAAIINNPYISLV